MIRKTILMVAGLAAVALADQGRAGAALQRWIVDMVGGALGEQAATALYGFVVLVVLRVAQVALARVPTRRRTLLAKLTWGVLGAMFGKEVVEENNREHEMDPRAKEKLRASLKRRYPILREEP